MGIILAGGLALAKPRLGVAPEGSATIIAVGRSMEDTLAIRDSLRAIAPTDVMRFVVFDTAAQVLSDEASVLEALNTSGPRHASLSVGLLAAIREAKLLASDYESVRIVLVSAFSRGEFDEATRSVRGTWGDSLSILRVRVAPNTPQAAQVTFDATGDDPAVAGIRLALSNRLMTGSSRVVRDVPTTTDTAFASAGGTLVLWPRQGANADDRVEAVHVGDATAIGHMMRKASVVDSGTVIARWADGAPAAHEIALGSGCIRNIGFDVPDLGDFVLTPSFQRLVSVLVSPCGERFDRGVVPDSVISELAAVPATRAPTRPPDESRGPNRVAAMLMALAILLALAELSVRRGIRTMEHAA